MKCKWCANPESQSSGIEVMAHPDKCIGCKKCMEVCKNPFDLYGIEVREETNCINCGACAEVCYAGARKLTGKRMSVKEVITETDKDMIFYKQSGGGITFSGGEAMLYPEFVSEIAGYYKSLGISTAIETCGDVPWDNFEKVIPTLDLVLFDLKLMDSKLHEKYTGRPNERILDNLKHTAEKIETIVRMPIIPTINDCAENIEAVGNFLKLLNGKVKKIHILPYHNYGMSKYKSLGKRYQLEDLKAPDSAHMECIKNKLAKYELDVVIGG